MLFFDFVLYLCLYYYIDNIAIWHSVGVPRPPWFRFTSSYWNEILGKPPVVDESSEQTDAMPESEFVESEDDAHLKNLVQTNRCVTIRGLHKTFTNAAGEKINAVSDLSLTMYQDECFCLLGHNG